ncbi:MAG: histidinol-phosphatase [Acidobacteria bacterium]|nr:histidinol-phosphatase [Acidobacteriota bacterium]
MVIRTSYHNHTTWSDGTATLDEMIAAARSQGMAEFGISDHFVLAPDNKRRSWAMDHEFIGEYVRRVTHAKENTPDLTIRLGLEVDYFPQTFDRVSEILSNYRFDYLILSVHFVGDVPIDYEAGIWERLSQQEQDSIWRRYWELLRAAAKTRFFDFAGHFDLPKKFGFFPSVDLTDEALAALDSIAASDMAIEINTAGWNKPVQQPYPSLFYLKEACKRGIPLLINADAHSADNVARNLDRGRELAEAAGYREVVAYQNRKRLTIPLR